MYIFPTGPITLYHHLASRRPHMHYVYFSHRSHHNVSPSGLQEATCIIHTFFPQVLHHCITIWPLGGHSCMMYIFLRVLSHQNSAAEIASTLFNTHHISHSYNGVVLWFSKSHMYGKLECHAQFFSSRLANCLLHLVVLWTMTLDTFNLAIYDLLIVHLCTTILLMGNLPSCSWHASAQLIAYLWFTDCRHLCTTILPMNDLPFMNGCRHTHTYVFCLWQTNNWILLVTLQSHHQKRL